VKETLETVEAVSQNERHWLVFALKEVLLWKKEVANS
jgi:hypothetical protein